MLMVTAYTYSAVEPAGLRCFVHLQCLSVEMKVMWSSPLLGLLEVYMQACTATGC